MSGGLIFIVMAILCIPLVMWHYWGWYENHPTTEEIIKDSLDKQNL